MTAAVDPIEAVRAYLAANADVSTLCNKRVGADEVPESDAANMPVAAVVVKAAGGPGSPGSDNDFGKTRVDVICYGASLKESRAVWLAVYAVLKGMTRNVSQGVLLHSATCTAKGSTARDPLKQWPTTYSSWLVLASEIAAT